MVRAGATPEGGEGSLANAPVYRYVSEGEAKVAQETGMVPNVNTAGETKLVFYSPDSYSSTSEAEQALQVGESNPGGPTARPTYRITVSGEGIEWTYGGNVEGGSGVEITTEQSVPVVMVEPLEP